MDTILSSMKRAGRAAFRTREYAALLGKRAYARLVLHRLKLKRELALIRKGWWAFPDAVPEAVACEISKPCYISFHSALFLHGLTTQVPRGVQIAVIRKTRQYEVFGMRVKEFKIKNEMFNNFYRKDGLLLASQEKAFADSLSLPRACPEIVLSEVLPSIEIDKLKRLIYSDTAKKRLGRLMRNAGQE